MTTEMEIDDSLYRLVLLLAMFKGKLELFLKFCTPT